MFSILVVTDYQTALIIPDCHIGFENRTAYQLMLDVARDLGTALSEIVILGDFADFYSINAHGAKDPALVGLLMREVECVNYRLDELDKLFPSQKKVFICGNHEYRLHRYLINRAPELYGIIDVAQLFKLRERFNWSFIPYDHRQKYQVLGSKLWARHQPPGSSPKAIAARVMGSLIYGHTHRLESTEVVAIDGTVCRIYGAGWLGDSNAGVFDYVKDHPQWGLGFSICHAFPDGNFFNQLIPITKIERKYQCFYGGKLYENT